MSYERDGDYGRAALWYEAAADCLAQVFAECLMVGEAVQREGDGPVVLGQQRGDLGRPIPRAKVVEGNLRPVIGVGQLGRSGESNRHDEG